MGIIFTSSYSTNKAIWKKCNLVKDFLKTRKIPFIEVDLATHPLAKEELTKRMPPEMAMPPIVPPQVSKNQTISNDYCSLSNEYRQSQIKKHTWDNYNLSTYSGFWTDPLWTKL